MANNAEQLAALTAQIVDCRACPRLVAWREQVAREKRAAYRDWDYWARPVPGFGDPGARIFVLGLAPAAHGGNRTGRVFTGDRSGDFLYQALFETGLANQPTSRLRDDGLALRNVYIAAAVRCAPPANKPTPAERDTCAPFLEREWQLLERARVIVALGSFAYEAGAKLVGLRPRPKFGHGLEVHIDGGKTILCSFHPSQQNTFTGRLTADMFRDIFARARQLAGGCNEPAF